MQIAKKLKQMGIELEDMGKSSLDDDALYPDIAKRVCDKVISGEPEDRGIICCGTGIGVCLTANKFQGIYAAVGSDAYSAERSIMSNDCNVLCFGSLVTGAALACKIVEEWVQLKFAPSRSSIKIERIREIEAENFSKAKEKS
jgi:ribose 5-phosphate isomerase B